VKALAEQHIPIAPSKTTTPIFFDDTDPKNRVINRTSEAANQPIPMVKNTSCD
jgi:hypothetical protein